MDNLEQKLGKEIQEDVNIIGETLQLEEGSKNKLEKLRQKYNEVGWDTSRIENVEEAVDNIEEHSQIAVRKLKDAEKKLKQGKDKEAAEEADAALTQLDTAVLNFDSQVESIGLLDANLGIDLLEVVQASERIKSRLKPFLKKEGMIR